MKDETECNSKQLNMKNTQQLKKIFVDTNILLNPKFNLNDYQKVYISIVSIEELDGLKNSEKVSYQARKAIKNIKSSDNVKVITNTNLSVNRMFLEHGNDNIILSMAFDVYCDDEEVIFISDDYNLIVKAQAFNIPCEMFEFEDNKEENKYNGYKEVIISEDEELAKHYETSENRWGLLNNEFLIIRDKNGVIIDKQRYFEGKGFVSLKSKPFKSIYFPDFKPRDEYQMLAMDSLINDDLTLLFGKAGSCKTYLSLSWIMQNIQIGKVGKCIIIFNPAKLKNNEQLGYYSGSRTEKLLQNSIGGILSSKFGDMTLVESLINNGKLMIIPTSDIRGIEISDNDCLFVTEAQNTDAYTMRTIIERAKEGCKIILEGDMLEQQDIRNNGRKNGMQRVIDVFKGTKYFSCVKLKNIYRSPLADIAQDI